MGEKGNTLGGATEVLAAMAPTESLMERVTTTTTQSVVGLGQDLADTIREKGIGAVADQSVAAARQKLQRGEEADGGADSGGEPPAVGRPGPV